MTIADTIDARHALDMESDLSLGFLASIYDPVPLDWKSLRGTDRAGGAISTDALTHQRYNATDCVETARSWSGIMTEPEWPDAATQYERNKRMSVVAAEMRRTGFRVDGHRRRALDKELADLYNGRKSAVARLLGCKPLGALNPNVLRSIAYARYTKPGLPSFGLPDPPTKQRRSWTKTGKVSVEQEELLRLTSDPTCPEGLRKVIYAYWRAEAARLFRRTFVSSDLVSRAIWDCRVHPQWNPRGTAVGRWSCSKPNIQNLAADKDTDALAGQLPNVRSMYTASPGHVLVHSDFSKFHPRIMLAMTGDANLEAWLATNLYKEVACRWMGKASMDDVTDAEYKQCKIEFLAFQYGVGPERAWLQNLKSFPEFVLTEAQRTHRLFRQTFPGIVAYWGAQREFVAAHGYSVGAVWGYKRYWPTFPDPADIANFPILSTEAAIANEGLLRLTEGLRAIPGAALVAYTHDAYDVDVPEGRAGEVERLMQDVLVGPHEINGTKWDFPLDVKRGERWSDV